MRRQRLDQISWEDFQKLPLTKKGPYFQQGDGRPYHVLIAQQFDRDGLEQLCQLATRIRRIAKSKQGHGNSWPRSSATSGPCWTSLNQQPDVPVVLRRLPDPQALKGRRSPDPATSSE